MDQDGANVKYLTLGNELVLTPRFSPKNQLVTYLSYFRNLPRVYLLDIETGVQTCALPIFDIKQIYSW